MRFIRPIYLLPLLTLTLFNCTSAQKKNLKFARARAETLKPLSSFQPTWCRVDAHLTQPAIARYRQLFPKELDRLTAESLPYSWKATEGSCEVTPLHRSPLTSNYQGFLDVALCLLAQTHFVNSPFDELELDARRMDAREGRVLIRTGDDQDLGIYLDRQTFAVETKTKVRGTLKVDYAKVDERWLPTRMAQRLGTTLIEVSAIEYAPATPEQPRVIKGFTIGVGDEKAVPHSHVVVSECQKF